MGRSKIDIGLLVDHVLHRLLDLLNLLLELLGLALGAEAELALVVVILDSEVLDSILRPGDALHGASRVLDGRKLLCLCFRLGSWALEASSEIVGHSLLGAAWELVDGWQFDRVGRDRLEGIHLIAAHVIVRVHRRIVLFHQLLLWRRRWWG